MEHTSEASGCLRRACLAVGKHVRRSASTGRLAVSEPGAVSFLSPPGHVLVSACGRTRTAVDSGRWRLHRTLVRRVASLAAQCDAEDAVVPRFRPPPAITIAGKHVKRPIGPQDNIAQSSIAAAGSRGNEPALNL